MPPQYRANILKVFNQSTPIEIIQGVSWYASANKVATELSEAFNIPVDRACLVISALSPNNNWTRNISDAWKDAHLCESVMQTCYYHVHKQYAEQKVFRVPEELKESWQLVANRLNTYWDSIVGGCDA